jgi:hypothetical protein
MREPRQDCLLLNMLALPGHTSEQRTGDKPKRLLTGRAPYRFESISLQQRVFLCIEPEGRRRRASLFCGGLLVHRIETRAGPAESPRAGQFTAATQHASVAEKPEAQDHSKTQAVKARLLAEAVHCDQLAADAEHLADEYLGFREGDIATVRHDAA